MDIPARKVSDYWILVGCIVFAFLLYGNTLFNKYCLDDAIVITQNKFTQRGLDGIKDIFTTESFTGFFGTQKQLVAGARYRPLSIASFAIEKEFFGKSPAISHFINILLYAFTAFFLYLLLNFVFREDKPKYVLVPLLATALFLFHPVHTEVVANIKGRDEIFALLFSLIACFLVLKSQTKIINLVFAGLFWFMAMLSKENAFVFIVLMPLLLYSSGLRTFKLYLKPLFSFIIASGLFFIIRSNVLGAVFSGASDELMNNSFLGATIHQKYATICYILGKYLQLIVFPHPLTFDYYPYHISLTGWDNFMSVFALVFYFFMGIAFFIFLKNKTPFALSIAFYILPLVPVVNLFFPIGTFMSERFLFFSSVGYCILLAVLFAYIYSSFVKYRFMLVSLISLILLLFTFKTIQRNKAWYNDYTLFTTDVKTSVNSAKSNCSAGGVLYESVDTISNSDKKPQILRLSIAYLQRSIHIHPKYADAWLLLGNAYFKLGNRFDSAVYCYQKILELNPNSSIALTNLFAVSESAHDTEMRINALKLILAHDPRNFQAYYKIGSIYGKEKNNIDLALEYLIKAREINPNSRDVYIDLGVAFGLKKEFARSAEMLEYAYTLDKNDVNVCINLGLTYQFLGKKDKAKLCFLKADSLKHLK